MALWPEVLSIVFQFRVTSISIWRCLIQPHELKISVIISRSIGNMQRKISSIITLVRHKKARFDSKMHGSTQKSRFDTKMPSPACISWHCHYHPTPRCNRYTCSQLPDCHWQLWRLLGTIKFVDKTSMTIARVDQIIVTPLLRVAGSVCPLVCRTAKLNTNSKV